jgi:hypothetical protein
LTPVRRRRLGRKSETRSRRIGGTAVIAHQKRIGTIIIATSRGQGSMDTRIRLERHKSAVASRHDFSHSSPGGWCTTTEAMVMSVRSGWWGFITFPTPWLEEIVIWKSICQ